MLLAAVTAVVFFLLGRGTAPDGQTLENPQSRVSASPMRLQDEASAVDAATHFARVMTGPSGDPDAYVEQMTSIASTGWRKRAEALARNGIEFVEERYGAGGSVEFHPIRFRVRSHSSTSAVIDIWGVVLASGPKVGGIEESWITGTVNLVWERSRWKVSGQSSTGGPTPELLQTEEENTVDEVLNEFEGYGDAAAS